jgi:hypothetical protein
MRNRALHDALREFALEAAALLCDEQGSGAELEFDVTEERRRRGPALYRYRPLTESYIDERWQQLRALPSCAPAAEMLGSGAASYLRLNGLPGAKAEPALQAMLERLYEDATSFAFPEERFERVYREVESTLYENTMATTILAPLPGLRMDAERVELGDGLSIARGEPVGAPPEAVWPEEGIEGEPAVVCMLERDVSSDDPLPLLEARERFQALVTALRLFRAGGVTLGATGWRQAAEGRWTPFDLDGSGALRGEPWELAEGEESELREFLDAIDRSTQTGSVAWALARFDMGCGRVLDAEALSDYLLGLRALLDAASDTGRASLALRLAALCAEEGERRNVQRSVELALSLERFVMGGGRGEELQDWIGSASPRALVDEMERHLRALLRDVLCGYLDGDLKGVADDILLESPEPPAPEPFEIEARDLRRETGPTTVSARRAEAETTDFEAVERRTPEPAREPMRPPEPEGVTPSVDWDEDPRSYSAPV